MCIVKKLFKDFNFICIKMISVLTTFSMKYPFCIYTFHLYPKTSSFSSINCDNLYFIVNLIVGPLLLIITFHLLKQVKKCLKDSYS